MCSAIFFNILYQIRAICNNKTVEVGKLFTVSKNCFEFFLGAVVLKLRMLNLTFFSKYYLWALSILIIIMVHGSKWFKPMSSDHTEYHNVCFMFPQKFFLQNSFFFRSRKKYWNSEISLIVFSGMIYQ